MRKQNFQWHQLSLGTCYYPEHWDESLWESDLDRMLANGIGTIRIAEFAWSKVEPLEGEFTYTFWDNFLDMAHKKGMKVIFCTPFATPPAWLSEKYPEILNCSKEGIPYRHGMRCNYTPNSEKFVELSSIITEKIARHYGNHPAIVGWQIGNEQNCETNEYYSEADTKAFRIFLQNRYGTLDRLNEAWGTVFWNETYTDWGQVYLPRPTVAGNNNPHQVLDYKRFISDSIIRFTAIQREILRKYIPAHVYITTNGIFGNLDNHLMEDDTLDVYTYDSYPNFAYALNQNPETDSAYLKDRKWSKTLSEVRSVCTHFGIMEQQSGANGWNYRLEGPAPKPGQLSLWALQSVAHGADYISFFRWRTCTFSTEMYWHGILDYDNRDNRKLAEVNNLSKRIAKMQDITGANFDASFAVITDYDNIFDAEVDLWHGRISHASENEIFVASQLTHTPMDYLDLRDTTDIEELCRYPVLIYPHAVILTQKRVELLTQYVKQGGTLLFGARTGQKNIDGVCVMEPMPAGLRQISGANVSDFTFIGPYDEPSCINWNGEIIDAGIFNDILQINGEHSSISMPSPASGDKNNADNIKIMAQYTNNYYQGKPALVETSYGLGRVLQFGGTFTRHNFPYFLAHLGILSPYETLLSVPKEVELVARSKEHSQWFFLLNYQNSSQTVDLKTSFIDVENNQQLSGTFCLAPYEVMLLKRINNK